MRYFLLVIGIVAVVAGGFFNEIVLKNLDIGMFGSSRNYYGGNDNQFIKVEFLNNPALLGETTAMFRERIFNLFKASTNDLGQDTRIASIEHTLQDGTKVQEVLMETGPAVQKQAGAFSAGNYEIEIQGYRPGGGTKFFNTVDVYLSDPGMPMWLPVPMQFVDKITAYRIEGNITQNDGTIVNEAYDTVEVAVFKSSQETWETKVKELYPNDFKEVQSYESILNHLNTIAGNLENTDITTSGYTEGEFDKDIAILNDVLNATSNGEYGDTITAAAQEFSFTLAGGMAAYISDKRAHLFSKDGEDMTIAEELDWIYQRLIVDEGVSPQTAAEIVFILTTACAVEIPLAESKVALSRTNMWEMYTSTTFTTAGQWWQFWNDKYDKSEYGQNIIRQWSEGVCRKLSTTYSPIALVARPPGDSENDQTAMTSLLNHLIPYCIPYDDVKDKKEMPENLIREEYNYVTPVDCIQLDMDLVQAIYFAVLSAGQPSYDIMWTFNNMSRLYCEEGMGNITCPLHPNPDIVGGYFISDDDKANDPDYPAKLARYEACVNYYTWKVESSFLHDKTVTIDYGSSKPWTMTIGNNGSSAISLIAYVKQAIPAFRDIGYMQSIQSILKGSNPTIKNAFQLFSDVLDDREDKWANEEELITWAGSTGAAGIARALSLYNACILNRDLQLTKLRKVDVARYGEDNQISNTRMYLYPFMTGGPVLHEALNAFLLKMHAEAPGTYDRNVTIYSMFWDYNTVEFNKRLPNPGAGIWYMGGSNVDGKVKAYESFLYRASTTHNTPIKWAAYWEVSYLTTGFNLAKIGPHLNSDSWHEQTEYVNIWAAFFNAYPLDCLQGAPGTVRNYTSEWYNGALSPEQRAAQSEYSMDLEALMWDCALTEMTLEGDEFVVREDGTAEIPMKYQDDTLPNKNRSSELDE